MPKCNFCSRGFKNVQAVRRHMGFCEPYLSTTKKGRAGRAPLGTATGTYAGTAPVAASPSLAERVLDQVEAEEARLKLRGVQAAHRKLDEAEAERLRKDEEARQRQRAAAREEADRQHQAEEAELTKARRRAIVKSVKHEVIDGVYAMKFMFQEIPGEVKAEALMAIEHELLGLNADEIPRSELIHIAESIRDRVYSPHIESRGQAKREAEEWGRTKRERVEFGLSYADDELRGENLGAYEGWRIRLAIDVALNLKLTGQETDAAVEGLVDEIIERELSS